VSPVRANIAPVQTDPSTELALYQIAKETLSNSLAHAHATEIAIELAPADDGVVLTLRDNGVGFDPAIEKEGHFGLHIIRERADAIGADIYVDSAPGEGSRVTVLAPASNKHVESTSASS
jgi:signal transduction histidine kinase